MQEAGFPFLMDVLGDHEFVEGAGFIQLQNYHTSFCTE